MSTFPECKAIEEVPAEELQNAEKINLCGNFGCCVSCRLVSDQEKTTNALKTVIQNVPDLRPSVNGFC